MEPQSGIRRLISDLRSADARCNLVDAFGKSICRHVDLLLRVNAEESHHGISGRTKRPVGFKTHTFHTSSAGFQHRCGCLVARSMRPHPCNRRFMYSRMYVRSSSTSTGFSTDSAYSTTSRVTRWNTSSIWSRSESP